MSSIRLYLWPHRLLLLGPGFDTGLHRHHAAQICFGLDGPLRLRTAKEGSWLKHGGFYVPPDYPHEFGAEIAGTAIIYVEAESAEFAALREVPIVGPEVTPLQPEPQACTVTSAHRDGRHDRKSGRRLSSGARIETGSRAAHVARSADRQMPAHHPFKSSTSGCGSRRWLPH